MSKDIPTYKIALLGQSGVGKSSIILRFIKDHWSPETMATIGASFFNSNVNVNNQMIRLDIWDTAGQERYHSLAPMYYRTAKVIIVVFDITDENSYQQAKKWIDEVAKYCEKEQPIIFLVANKIDTYIGSENTCLAKHGEAEEYAKHNSFFYMEVSAKTGTGIMELFHDVASQLHIMNKPVPKSTVQVTDIITYGKSPNVYGCC